MRTDDARMPGLPGPAQRTQPGFTLVELAVVIAIVGFLLGALLLPLSTQVSLRRNQETDQAMSDIVRALYGFAATQGRLPYPDTAAIPTGDEGSFSCPTPSPGAVVVGVLPWKKLGLPPTDAWGRLYLYAVTSEFACTAVPGMPAVANSQGLTLADSGALAVYTRGDNPATTGTVETKYPVALTTTGAALVMSYGADGYGGYDFAAGQSAAAPAAGTDEAENANGDANFVSRPPSEGGAGCSDGTAVTAPGSDTTGPFCQFDDIVKWLPTPTVLGELVKAGWLP